MHKPTFQLGAPHCDLDLSLRHYAFSIEHSEKSCHLKGIQIAIETGFLRDVLCAVAMRDLGSLPLRQAIRKLLRRGKFVLDEDINYSEFVIDHSLRVALFWTRSIDQPEFWKIFDEVEDDHLLPDHFPLGQVLEFIRANSDKRSLDPLVQLLHWMVLTPGAHKVMQPVRADITSFPRTRKLGYFIRLASALESESVADDVRQACSAHSSTRVEREAIRI